MVFGMKLVWCCCYIWFFFEVEFVFVFVGIYILCGWENMELYVWCFEFWLCVDKGLDVSGVLG